MIASIRLPLAANAGKASSYMYIVYRLIARLVVWSPGASHRCPIMYGSPVARIGAGSRVLDLQIDRSESHQRSPEVLPVSFGSMKVCVELASIRHPHQVASNIVTLVFSR